MRHFSHSGWFLNVERRHSRSMQTKYDSGLRPPQRASGVAPGPGRLLLAAAPAAAAEAAAAAGVAATPACG
jgi:hypothetical protein